MVVLSVHVPLAVADRLSKLSVRGTPKAVILPLLVRADVCLRVKKVASKIAVTKKATNCHLTNLRRTGVVWLFKGIIFLLQCASLLVQKGLRKRGRSLTGE
jgi:predicted DNA-binding transcriptional regulator